MKEIDDYIKKIEEKLSKRTALSELDFKILLLLAIGQEKERDSAG